jgi:hypothetical protein
MADTSNHVKIFNIAPNADLDAGGANDTLDSWEEKSKRIKGANVRDEALDSWALGQVRSTHIASRGVKELFLSDITHKYNGWLGNGDRLLPIQPASGSLTWKIVNMGWKGLGHDGDPDSPSLPDDNPVAIEFHLNSDASGYPSTYNSMNRWVLYCSCEVAIQRPRGMKGGTTSDATRCPTVELALAYRWAADGHTNNEHLTIISGTRRGFGIGNPPDNVVGNGKGTLPTSLSYSSVHAFNPNFLSNSTDHTRADRRLSLFLVGRYEDGRDFHANDYVNRFYWAASNVSLFAVNYRR